MTNVELQSMYCAYNKLYFHNKLPRDMVAEFGKCGGCNIGLTRIYKNRPLFIIIDKRIKSMRTVALMTLLHEMVHVELPTKADGHGKIFQKAMLRLAKAGAFNKLW